jgi:hypothetical protein
MNMTKLGKILVFVNLAFGMALFAWALGIYTNRIDFSNTKGGAGKTEGELTKRADRIKQTVENLNNYAQPRWIAARNALKVAEDVRVANQNFYVVQLKNLEDGQPPLLTPVYVNGDLQRAPTGLPRMEDSKLVDSNNGPLKSLKFYGEEMGATQKKIDQEIATIRTLIEQERKLTEELSGPDGNGGYRGQVDREKVREQRIHEETRDLRPLIVNTLVESELLLKRQRQLTARVKELEARAAR